MSRIAPSRGVVWSTDSLDLSDPFQRKWYIQQVLTHGRAADIQALDLDEVMAMLDDLWLPPEVRSLWQRFREVRHACG
jgi:hypothetical protein